MNGIVSFWICGALLDLVAYLFGPMEGQDDNGRAFRDLICQMFAMSGLKIGFINPEVTEVIKTGETAEATKRIVNEAIRMGDLKTFQDKLWPIKTIDLETVRFLATLDGKKGRPRGILIGCFPRSPNRQQADRHANDFIKRYADVMLKDWETRQTRRVSQRDRTALLSFFRRGLAGNLGEYIQDTFGRFTATAGSSLEVGEAHRLLIPTFLIPDNDLVPKEDRVTKEEFMTKLTSKWVVSDVEDTGDFFEGVGPLISFLRRNMKSIKNGRYMRRKKAIMDRRLQAIMEKELVIEV